MSCGEVLHKWARSESPVRTLSEAGQEAAAVTSQQRSTETMGKALRRLCIDINYFRCLPSGVRRTMWVKVEYRRRTDACSAV